MGRPKASSPHQTASGLSGSPTLATNRSAGNAKRLAMSTPAFISMRTAVGAVYQRRDDAVGGAGDPSGVRRAPEDVVGVQVERVLARRVMREHRAMHVDR